MNDNWLLLTDYCQKSLIITAFSKMIDTLRAVKKSGWRLCLRL